MSKFFSWWDQTPTLARRQLAVAIVCGVAVLLWRYVFCPPAWATLFVRFGGWYVELATYVVFAIFVARALRRAWRGWTELWTHRWGLAAIALGTVVLQVHEPHEYKVLYDEYMLGGVAHNMHFLRQAAMPDKMHYVNGRLYPQGGIVDKRPLAFPFLVATMHDLTGYRPSNAWIVNGVLAVVLFGLVYATGLAWAGPRAGITGVLLMAGLPLLAQNATGAGFDLLNMVLLAAVFLAAVQYLSASEPEEGLNLLVFTAILLASVRYESLLFLLALPVLAWMRWQRDGQARLSWWTAYSPLFLVLPLASQQVYFANDYFFQTTRSNFLDLSHAPDNLAHALYFLFQWTHDQPNSLLLSAVGTVALVMAIVVLGREAGSPQIWSSADLAFMVFLPLVLLNTGLLMGLDWGRWDDPSISRYALPFLLGLVWCVLWLLSRWKRPRPLPWWIPTVVGVYAYGLAVPNMAEAQATHNLYPREMHAWAEKWLEAHAGPNTLAVAASPLPFIVYRRAGISLQEANNYPEKLKNAVDLGMYHDIYILQPLKLNPTTGKFEPEAEDRLNPDTGIMEKVSTWKIHPGIQTEVVAQTRLHTALLGRILRVTGFNPNWKTEPTPDLPAPTVPPLEDKEMLQEFMLKQYP
jgi:hypothetical protein